MFPEATLRNSDLFVAAITRIVERYPDGHRGCSVESLIYGSSGEAIFCLIRAGISMKTKCAALDYGKMRLQRRVFDPKDLRSLLAKFYATGTLDVAGEKISFAAKFIPPQQTSHKSESPYHQWPGTLYSLGATGRMTPGMQEPLVGRGLPPFFNPQDAVTNWIGIPIGSSDNRLSQLLVFLPNFTARLGKIAFADGALSVKATFASKRLFVSVLAKDSRQTFRKTKPLRRAQTFKLMPNPEALEIFITTEDGEIVDSFAEQQGWTTRERVIFATARYSRETMELIRHGESDVVEFKEFVRLDDMKKAAELVKAVISFANTRGGTIFIGVADDAEIVGIEGQIPHDERKAATFEKDYFDRLNELLKQKLNRIPRVEIGKEKLGDKAVFVVRVTEGDNKPYFNLQTREIFVRRGANDVRPEPDTDLAQMFAAGLITGRDVF